jgi:hypothetical protein
MNHMKRNNFVVFSGCSTIWMNKLMTQPSRYLDEQTDDTAIPLSG